MALFGRSGKRDNVFIRLLQDHARKVQIGVEWLKRFAEEGDEESAKNLEQCEEEADELRRVLIDELHKTFITPFDREDIFDLSLYLDDVLDYAYTTVEEMQLLEVEADGHLVQMIADLCEAASELVLAMDRLVDNPMVALDHARRVKHQENQVEHTYRMALAELFSGAEEVHHVVQMLRIREVYRHVNNAADRADLAANVIGSVVMKMT